MYFPFHVRLGHSVPFDRNRLLMSGSMPFCAISRGLGSCAMKSEFNRFWPVDLHLVGKESSVLYDHLAGYAPFHGV